MVLLSVLAAKMMVGEVEVKERPRPSPDYLMQLLNEKKLMTSLPNLCGIFTHLERLLDEGKWRCGAMREIRLVGNGRTRDHGAVRSWHDFTGQTPLHGAGAYQQPWQLPVVVPDTDSKIALTGVQRGNLDVRVSLLTLGFQSLLHRCRLFGVD